MQLPVKESATLYLSAPDDFLLLRFLRPDLLVCTHATVCINDLATAKVGYLDLASDGYGSRTSAL
jgi:hypothetical protein